MSDRLGIGGNAPPIEEQLALDHAELARRAAEAAALVPSEVRAIETDEEAAAYTDTAADIKVVLKEADAAFTAAKAPWLAGGRTVDGFFADIRRPLDLAAKRLVAALDARANAILAAKRKADAEAAEKARREALAFDEPVAIVATAPLKDVARVVGTFGIAATSTKWVHRVVDPEKVPRQYLMINENAIKAAVAGGTRAIPGVEIYEEARTSIRR